MSNVHPLRRMRPEDRLLHPATGPTPGTYTWSRYNEDAFVIVRDGIVVGFVSIFPEIPFHSELVAKLPAVFAEHERVLRGDAS